MDVGADIIRPGGAEMRLFDVETPGRKRLPHCGVQHGREPTTAEPAVGAPRRRPFRRRWRAARPPLGLAPMVSTFDRSQTPPCHRRATLQMARRSTSSAPHTARRPPVAAEPRSLWDRVTYNGVTGYVTDSRINTGTEPAGCTGLPQGLAGTDRSHGRFDSATPSPPPRRPLARAARGGEAFVARIRATPTAR